MELDDKFLNKYEKLVDNNVEKALKYCIEILKKTKNPDYYVYIADCLMGMDNYEDAIGEIDKAIGLKCKNKDFALILKAEALFYLNRYVESKELFEKLLIDNPNSFFITIYLIDLDIIEGNYVNGIEKAKNIIITGNLTNDDLAYIEAKIGCIYLECLNDYNNAFKSFNRALYFSLEVGTVYVGLGEYYLKTNNYLKAKANFKKAIELGEETLEVYYSMALVYKALGNFKDSLSYFKLVQQVDKNYKEISTEVAKMEKHRLIIMEK